MQKIFQCADGVLVPGGFGHVEGKILAAKYARENNVPYLGICLGMQVAVIEFARSNLGLKDANSRELDAGTRYPCPILMPEVTVVSEFLWACIFLRVDFMMLLPGRMSMEEFGDAYACGNKEDFLQNNGL